MYNFNGYKSRLLHVTSGIPQGSNLGPLMFILFINDLVESINTHTHKWMFADDLKTFTTLYSIND